MKIVYKTTPLYWQCGCYFDVCNPQNSSLTVVYVVHLFLSE